MRCLPEKQVAHQHTAELAAMHMVCLVPENYCNILCMKHDCSMINLVPSEPLCLVYSSQSLGKRLDWTTGLMHTIKSNGVAVEQPSWFTTVNLTCSVSAAAASQHGPPVVATVVPIAELPVQKPMRLPQRCRQLVRERCKSC